MKIGYSNRPDFDSRRGGLGQTKSGKLLCFFSFVFFFPQPAAAGWGKQNQACKLFLGRYNL